MACHQATLGFAPGPDKLHLVVWRGGRRGGGRGRLRGQRVGRGAVAFSEALPCLAGCNGWVPLRVAAPCHVPHKIILTGATINVTYAPNPDGTLEVSSPQQTRIYYLRGDKDDVKVGRRRLGVPAAGTAASRRHLQCDGPNAWGQRDTLMSLPGRLPSVLCANAPAARASQRWEQVLRTHIASRDPLMKPLDAAKAAKSADLDVEAELARVRTLSAQGRKVHEP